MKSKFQLPIKVTISHALANAVDSEYFMQTVSEVIQALEQHEPDDTKVYLLLVSTQTLLVQIHPTPRISPRSILERNLLSTYTGYIGFITVSWAGELNKPRGIQYTIRLENQDKNNKTVILHIGNDEHFDLVHIVTGGPRYRYVVYCDDVLGYGALIHGTNIELGSLRLVGANSNCYGYPIIKRVFSDTVVHLINNPVGIAQTKDRTQARFTYVLIKQDVKLYETKTKRDTKLLVSGTVVTLSDLLAEQQEDNQIKVVAEDTSEISEHLSTALDVLPELQDLTGIDEGEDIELSLVEPDMTNKHPNISDSLLVNTQLTLEELIDRFIAKTGTNTGLILYDTYNALPSTIECLMLERGLLRISDTGLFLLAF